MSISLSRYVDIASVVGAGAHVSVPNLGALIITRNDPVPTGKFISFNSADEVGDYFGTSSEEYLRSLFYFGWINKQGSAPNQLDFWFWNNDAATPSRIFGKPATYALSTFTAISTGQ